MVDARHLDKSPEAFRTISEVADELELPQHVLRFWETRFAHIRPVKRAGGRRYYRPDDVELLRGIRHLLYSEGYTIKGVQKILKDQGVRHVQGIGLDAGEPVGELDPAPPRSMPAPAPVSEDGGGFGGLLGLIPRRRPRPEPVERSVAQPGFDEPPLPFPDFANFTPRIEDEGAGARRSAPAAKAMPARSAPGPAPTAASGRLDRTEPVFRPASPTARIADDDRDLDPYGAHDGGRGYPAEPPAPRRAPPLQRPSRGPASRLPEPPAAPELEDPLLPFFDDDVAEQISEPLDARIRRLKEHAPPPAPPQVAPLPGPPEEYIPARARKRPPAPPEPEPRDARPADPRARAAPWPQTDPDDLDEEEDGEDSWARPMPPRRADDRQGAPRAARESAPARYRDAEADAYDDASTYGSAAARGGRPDPDAYARGGPVPDEARRRAEPRGRSEFDREPLPPIAAPRAGGRDPLFDAPPPSPVPPVAPPRVGLLRGPLEEYDPEDDRGWQPPPRPDGRGSASAARPGEGRRGPGVTDWTAEDEDWSAEASGRRSDDWRDDPRDAAPARPSRGPASGRDPGEDYLPPEPHRPGPPEQYLPPHLRSEPRLTGSPLPPAPVLSRDDIARLQSTLYELSECRRLMGAVLPGDDPDDLGD